MGINWEFILGLLLPAFGAWHIWLIKTAREDRDLYKLVRRQTQRLCYASIFALLVVTMLVNFVLDYSPRDREILSTLGSLAMLALCITLTSLPFFDAVAALEPKQTKPKQDASSHGGGQA